MIITRVVFSQVIAILVYNVLFLAIGMKMGFITIFIPAVSDENSDEAFYFNEEQISWIGSISLIWQALGSLLSGIVTPPMGNKRAAQIMILPFMASWLLIKFCTDPWQIFFALSTCGLSIGLMEAPLVAYIVEISQPHVRGTLAVAVNLSMALGALLPCILATFLNWRDIALLNCIVCLVSFCLLFLIPESPHWLVMKNRLQEARKSLMWLRGWTTSENVELEFKDILNAVKLKGESPTYEQKSIISSLRKFTQKDFLWPLLLLSFMSSMYAFTGGITTKTYAVTIFATLQVPIDEYHATIVLGVTDCIGSLLCVIWLRFIGKRLAILISATSTGICRIVVATYAYIKGINYLTMDGNAIPETDTTYEWIPLIFLILSAFLTDCGLKSVPGSMIGEVYTNETRMIGSGVSVTISQLLYFLSNQVFLKMISGLTLPGTFWFYGGVGFSGCIILYFILPETEGKPLQEIADHFSGVSKLDNKVRRNINRNENSNQSYLENDK